MVADNNGDGNNINLLLSFNYDFGYLQYYIFINIISKYIISKLLYYYFTHNFNILRDNACTVTKQKN